jgi:hypothetical protein
MRSLFTQSASSSRALSLQIPALGSLLPGRAVSLVAGLTAVLAFPLGHTQFARAAAEYCQTNYDGAVACLHSVFGPRNYRGVVYTINGVLYSTRINCYNYNYARTSILSVACWSYNAISDKAAKQLPAAKEASAAELKLLVNEGKPASSNTINLETIKKNLPAEMQ